MKLGLSLKANQHIGYTRLNWAACSRNKIRFASYVDICANASNLNRKLSIDQKESISLSLGHLSYRSNIGFYDLEFGFQRTFFSEYEQDQAFVSLDTIHEKQWYSSLRMRLGESVMDKLVLNYGLDASATKIIEGRSITISLLREISDGGKLLGVDRSDETTRLQVSVPISKSLYVKVGYAKTDSTIDYFDVSQPSIELTYSW